MINLLLLILSEPLSSPPLYSRVHVDHSLVYCSMLYAIVCLFVSFLLTIVLYVLLRLRLFIIPLVSSNSSCRIPTKESWYFRLEHNVVRIFENKIKNSNIRLEYNMVRTCD